MTVDAGRRLPTVDEFLGLIESGVPGVVLMITEGKKPDGAYMKNLVRLKQLVDKIIVVNIGKESSSDWSMMSIKPAKQLNSRSKV